MQYLVFDSGGASITIEKDGRYRMLLKHSIKRVSIVREDIIKIETGDPLESIVFRFKDVQHDPQITALEFLFLINTWITNCVCCNCNTEQPPL